MTNRVKIGWLVVACLVLGALSAFCATRRAPSADLNTMYSDITGKVVDDVSGEPVPGIPVSLLYETTITDASGQFSFKNVPVLHTAEVSLRVSTKDGLIIGCTTFDVPVRFYPISTGKDEKIDIKIVEPGVDKEIVLRIKQVSIDKVAEFCQTCHIDNPCLESSAFQTVVKTGKDLKGIIVKENELEAYRENLMRQGLNKDSYTRMRYQDTHPDFREMNSIVTDQGELKGRFVKPENLKLWVYKENDVEKAVVVCDTCHARHSPTEFRQFILMQFEEESRLCYQCHK